MGPFMVYIYGYNYVIIMGYNYGIQLWDTIMGYNYGIQLWDTIMGYYYGTIMGENLFFHPAFILIYYNFLGHGKNSNWCSISWLLYFYWYAALNIKFSLA
jgi:hypothetical protein